MHLARVPPQESPPSGAAGRLTRRDHHLAPRPALVRAHRRGDEPCGRSVIARPHGVRLGGTIRVNIDRVVPRGEAAAVLRTSGTPRVDSTTAGHRCGQRGVSCVDEEDRASGQRPERLASLDTCAVREWKRMRAPTTRCSRSCDCSRGRRHVRRSRRPLWNRIALPKRIANEGRHLRPVLVGEPAGRVDR